MTSETRGQEPAPRPPGYRGSLPPRNDRLGGPWVIGVLVAFVLIFVLSFAGLPSRFFPAATASPIPSELLPSISPAESLPTGSGSAAASESPAASATPATSAPSPTPAPSASAAPSAS
jgi:hypothetical protein